MWPRCLIALFAICLHSAATLDAYPSDHDAPGITSHIKRQPVVSSALAAIGYSKRLHALEIEFINGAIYRYLDVPPDVYRSLLGAESKTRFYDRNIRGHYRSLRVKPRKSHDGG